MTEVAEGIGHEQAGTSTLATPRPHSEVDAPPWSHGIRFGALCWNQWTDWPSLLEAGVLADRVGYESLWTRDHLYPIIGDPRGPIFEGWLMLAAWAQATQRIRLGLMVGANTFREPSLVAKMATTLDHISNGRAILGLGAGTFAPEHEAFGMPYGTGAPERLRWLTEALPIIRGMLDGIEPSATGPRYLATRTRNLPAPIQSHLPILVGGDGEQVTLKLVARYADACNISGGVEVLRKKDAILRDHCAAVGRDESEIERTTIVGLVFIRDSRAEAEDLMKQAMLRNRIDAVWQNQPVGTPEDVAERLAPYLEIGFRHLVASIPADFDEESMTRLITDVKPLLRSGQSGSVT
jgi:alkanesulfonate monooxygenase SsuD/methylene tetrahydromethanopterin reductase-like flavin-dependent oxidoreductase (luciferase family)